jgi:hypothetical protein
LSCGKKAERFTIYYLRFTIGVCDGRNTQYETINRK